MTQSPASNDRLISLDAMRGFTIAAMILVNYPGSWDHIYHPLEHAEWNGLTPTDLIFPLKKAAANGRVPSRSTDDSFTVSDPETANPITEN